MRIVVDMQGVQVERRGGRDVESLVREMSRQRGENTLLLALSGFHPDSVERVRASFDGLVPQGNIRVWHAPGPVRVSDSANRWRWRVATLVRESLLASLEPDVVFVPAFFADPADEWIMSVGEFATRLRTMVSFDALDRARTAGLIGDSSDHAILMRASLQRVDRVIELSDDTEFTAAVGRLLEIFGSSTNRQEDGPPAHPRRPRLAYVSPMPPVQSGVAEYSAEMVPELSRFYAIDVIGAGDAASPSHFSGVENVRSPEWFVQNTARYDRTLYHIGDSAAHGHMIELIERAPGAVVLHDFFLANLHRSYETFAPSPHAWVRALYHSHGYRSVFEHFTAAPGIDIGEMYPANQFVVDRARGIIVHSEYARSLAGRWYGGEIAARWAVVPLLRGAPAALDRGAARRLLGLDAETHLTCSFGVLTPNKLNHSALRAWLDSSLAADERCCFVFVGESPCSRHAEELMSLARERGCDRRVRITGWIELATYQAYLAVADLAIQLRTRSRGETSASVLDCLNHGLPTITNAHGSNAEVPSECVWMLDDVFDPQDLVIAMETLRGDEERSSVLARRGRELIQARHRGWSCVGPMVSAIESFHEGAGTELNALLDAIARRTDHLPSETERRELSHQIARTLKIAAPHRAQD